MSFANGVNLHQSNMLKFTEKIIRLHRVRGTNMSTDPVPQVIFLPKVICDDGEDKSSTSALMHASRRKAIEVSKVIRWKGDGVEAMFILVNGL